MTRTRVRRKRDMVDINCASYPISNERFGEKGNKLYPSPFQKRDRGEGCAATEKKMKNNKEAILRPIGKFLVKLYPVSKISVNFIFIINIMNKNKTAIAPTYITI